MSKAEEIILILSLPIILPLWWIIDGINWVLGNRRNSDI